MSDAKCAKKVMGNKPVSQATPEQLRRIEECGIRAAGGKPNPKVFGEAKKKRSKEKLKNLKKESPATMGSSLYGKKRKFKERQAPPPPNKTETAGKLNPVKMEGSPLYGKISSACKAAAKRKFKVWPSAYASGWGVRCTKAGGPGNYGNKKK